jgi:hypothetical protein
MLRYHSSSLGLASCFCLALSCAGVLGIEDAECDPSFARDCSSNSVGAAGGGGLTETRVPALLPANGGSGGGSAGAPGASGAAGAGGNSTSTAGAGGSPGAAGSSMAMAGGGGGSLPDPIAARASAQCLEYCETVGASCTGLSQQYASPQACLAVCELLQPGTPGTPTSPATGNSVACRLGQAQLAALTGEVVPYCTAAGPGGANVCGTDCEGYCTLMTAKCSREIGDRNQCLATCSIVPNLAEPPMNQGYNVSVSMQSGNSVQCRLFHVRPGVALPARRRPDAVPLARAGRRRVTPG